MLTERDYTAKEISQALGLKEKEVFEHLEHVDKSLGRDVTIIHRPAQCLRCDFEFKKRKRFTTPGRCPVCKSEHIADPVYMVSPKRRK